MTSYFRSKWSDLDEIRQPGAKWHADCGDICDVYVGGKVRVSEFMISLDLQHCGSK